MSALPKHGHANRIPRDAAALPADNTAAMDFTVAIGTLQDRVDVPDVNSRVLVPSSEEAPSNAIANLALDELTTAGTNVL